MRINYWKVATISLLLILFWLGYSGRPAAAQYGGQNLRITAIKYADFLTGTINVPGDVKGFSCASDTKGDLDKGDGHIETDVDCYVLSK